MRIHIAPCILGAGVLLALMACDGNSGTNPGDPDARADEPDAHTDMPDPDFTTLVAREWTIPAGTEIYRCTRVTLDRDMYLAGFRALAPLGTHHTVLSVRDQPTQPDGDYDCAPSSLSHSLLFASGVGTNDLIFPEGVGMKLRAGQQLELNLHLYNVSDAPITGTSGTLAKLLAEEEVRDEVEVVFGGQYVISLPHDPQNEQTVHGGCRFSEPGTIVALWPHMHQLGRHIKVTHPTAGTLLDKSFDFEEQINYPLEPLEMAAGERLEITCTYLNDTGRTVTFGDSSDEEMCFVGVYRYPSTGASLLACVEFGGS